MKTNVFAQITSLAAVLDSQGKRDADIAVHVSRRTLQANGFKRAEGSKRGTPLFHGKHELKLLPAGKRDPNTREMFTDEGRATAEARA